MTNDEFITLVGESTAETRVQGSRFLALAAPIHTAEEMDALLQIRRKRLFDATHHAYAYRLGVEGDSFRVNDDGEPAGSAGRPILNAIDQLQLTDIVVIVTRYFGGTKLGTGGLFRAYREAANAALSRGKPVQKHVQSLVGVCFPDAAIGDVMRVVSGTDARVIETAYDEGVRMNIEVRLSRTADLKRLLMDATRGKVRFRD